MPAFGTLSKTNLIGVHPKLVQIANVAVSGWDCQVTGGQRSLAMQQLYVARGASKTMDSKHLKQADGYSHAIDINPFPYDWDKIQKGYDAIKRATGGMEIAEFYAFAGFVDGIAWALGTNLRSGYDWNTNRQFEDQTFLDLPHHELR